MDNKDIKRLLNGKSVEEQLEFYKNYYDKVISFADYYPIMFPDWDGHFNTNCRLHGEKNGASFGYQSDMNLWTCWGSCQAHGQGSGRVVFYHYIYRKKFDPNFTLMKALKEIHKIFTSRPVDKNNRHNPLYASLPYPKLYKSTLVISTSVDDIQTAMPKVTEATLDVSQIELYTENNSSLSCRTLANFLTKKDRNNTYSERLKVE